MKSKSQLFNILAPIVLIVFIIIFWQIVCSAFQVSENLLPKPSQIFLALQRNFVNTIFPDMMTSLKNVIVGYIIAVPLGFIIAAISSQFKFITRMITPVLIILMVTPMATMVPEFKLFLGVSPLVKILIIILQCAPVIAVNSITGFTNVDKNKVDVMKAMGCGRWETFFRITIPNAMPEMFVGLKLGCILSTIAAMSADLSVGQGGLGYRISISASQRATDTAYATIFVAAVIGVLLYSLVSLIEKNVVTWK